MNVSEFVNLCLRQSGDAYVYGVEVSPSNPDPKAFDCSELVEWACARLGVKPTMPDGSWAQYEHCKAAGLATSVINGIHTYGALLFRGTGIGNPASEHVAISLGNGHTDEARGRAYGVNTFDANGRTWHAAALIPGLDYSARPPTQPAPVSVIGDSEMILVADASTGAFYLLTGHGLTYLHSPTDTDRLVARLGPVIQLGSDTLSTLPGYIPPK